MKLPVFLVIVQAALLIAVGAGQHFANFEQQHMHETHHIQISDEVTFFKLHDGDGDGNWDEGDLRALYGFERDVDAGAKHIRLIIDRVFRDLDTDQDGLISLEEYMRSKLPDWTPEEIKADKMWQEDHPPSMSGDDNNQQAHFSTPAEHNRGEEPIENPEWEEVDDEGDKGEEQQHREPVVPEKFKVHH